MATSKKRRLLQQATHARKIGRPNAKLPANTVPGKPKTKGKPQSEKKNPPNAQHAAPTILFNPDDNILLVGEGDLSFSLSLLQHHGCENTTATVLEKSAEELIEKYPQAEEHIRLLEDGGGKVKYGVDAGKMQAWTRGKEGIMDKIVFNFPHVGGKSTDVNRQVRFNQELLVSFFKRAVLSLAPGGSIIVTLFEGEPYTLWNIRDLGRHSGLQVDKSFKFQASAYPGYHHARTLGVVKNKNGEIGGGWKGEDRPARSYVFVRKGESSTMQPKKRKRDDSDDEDD